MKEVKQEQQKNWSVIICVKRNQDQREGQKPWR